MKEFVISDAQAETAVLVGLITQTQNERARRTNIWTNWSSWPIRPVPWRWSSSRRKWTVQLRDVCGQGKLEEKYIEAEEEGNEKSVWFSMTNFHCQLRNIEKELQVKILDRTNWFWTFSPVVHRLLMRRHRWNWRNIIYVARLTRFVDTLGTSGGVPALVSEGFRGGGPVKLSWRWTAASSWAGYPSETQPGRNRPPETLQQTIAERWSAWHWSVIPMSGKVHIDEPALVRAKCLPRTNCSRHSIRLSERWLSTICLSCYPTRSVYP